MVNPSVDGRRVQVETAFGTDGAKVHSVNIERVGDLRSVATYLTADGMLISPADKAVYGPTTLVQVDYTPKGAIENAFWIGATTYPVIEKKYE